MSKKLHHLWIITYWYYYHLKPSLFYGNWEETVGHTCGESSQIDIHMVNQHSPKAPGSKDKNEIGLYQNLKYVCSKGHYQEISGGTSL